MRTGTATTGTHTPQVTVTINGQTMPVDALKIERRIASSWPDGVIAGDSITPTLGEFTLGRRKDSGTAEPSPWRTGDLPQQGDPLTIDATNGTETHRLLTGRVDSVSGTVGGDITVGVVDNVDRLNKTITVPPMHSLLPPRNWSTGFPEGTSIRVQLHRQWLVGVLLAECGWHATPDPAGSRIMVPMVGSLMTAGLPTSGDHMPTTHGELIEGYAAASVTPTDASAFTATWRATTTQPATTTRTLHTRSFPGALWRFEVTGDRTAGWWVAQEGGRVTAGRIGYFPGIDLPEPAGGGIVRAVVSDGTLTVQAGDQTGTTSVPADQTPAARETLTQVRGDANRVSWVRLDAGTPDWRNFTPQVVIEARNNRLNYAAALPGFESRRILDVLRDLAGATGAAFWLDEDDTAHWVEATARTAWTSPSAAASATVRATDRLLTLGWQHAPLSARRRVRVTHEEPALNQTQGPTGSRTGWQAPSETIDPGQLVEWWATPTSGQEWVGICTRGVWEPSRWDSLVVPFAFTKEGDEHRKVPEDQMPFTVTRIGPQTVRIGVRNLTQLPVAKLRNEGTSFDAEGAQAAKEAYDKAHWQAVADTPPDGFYPPYLPPAWVDYSSSRAGQTTPTLPVWGITTWTDAAVTVGTTAVDVPELTHDAGRWMVAADVTVLANYVLAGASQPTPTIRDLSIIPDPRIQLGDRVGVIDDARSGANVKGVVFGITDQWTPGEWSQSLDVRIIPGTTITAATWAEVEDVWQPRSWQQVQDANPRTWKQMEADPLQGA